MLIPYEIQNRIQLMYAELEKGKLHNELLSKFEKLKTDKNRKIYYLFPGVYLWYEIHNRKKTKLDSGKINQLFRYLIENKDNMSRCEFRAFFKLLLKEGRDRNFEIENEFYIGQINNFDIMYTRSL